MGKPRNSRFINLSDKETLKTLLVDLRPANDISKEDSEDKIDDEEVLVQDENKFDPDLLNLAVADAKTCSLCSATFSDKFEQRQHFKLDWHRYNLKRRLQNKPVASEEDFEKMVEKNNESISQDQDDDNISLSGSEDSSEEDNEEQNNEMLKNRHPKYFFENAEKQIMSVYKCIFVDPKSNLSDSDYLSRISNILSTKFKYKWAILMLGGGHFAGAVFDGSKAIVHKTFHCYTVRAKQGGSQSMADNRSGTNHPKSAGASLRRYNQAALADHVRNILSDWKDHFRECDVIFYRAVSGNRTVLFGDGLLDKKDVRLRSIPFPTRRATFGEVKRVQEILSTVEIHSEASNEFRASFLSEISSGQQTKGRRSPTKSSKKSNNIRRSKSRESPKRPLPKMVQDLAALGSKDGMLDLADQDSDLTWSENVEFSTLSLSEFSNSAPPPKRNNKKQPRQKKAQVGFVETEAANEDEEEEDDESLINDATAELKNNLVTACKVGDALLLKKCLEDLDSETINIELGSDRWTALHIAAQSGKKQIVTLLLNNGADPTKRNKLKQVPYSLCKDKETRNAFRRFQAENPDKFDYVSALIPIEKPLTPEEEARQAAKRNEKKKAQKAAKKEKDKLLREEEEVKRKEEEEKKRFLNLSDREKRALAAEKRILEATGSVPTVQRCFQCAADISGLVPFIYLEYKFCKPACVKEHRQKANAKSK